MPPKSKSPLSPPTQGGKLTAPPLPSIEPRRLRVFLSSYAMAEENEGTSGVPYVEGRQTHNARQKRLLEESNFHPRKESKNEGTSGAPGIKGRQTRSARQKQLLEESNFHPMKKSRSLRVTRSSGRGRAAATGRGTSLGRGAMDGDAGTERIGSSAGRGSGHSSSAGQETILPVTESPFGGLTGRTRSSGRGCKGAAGQGSSVGRGGQGASAERIGCSAGRGPGHSSLASQDTILPVTESPFVGLMPLRITPLDVFRDEMLAEAFWEGDRHDDPHANDTEIEDEAQDEHAPVAQDSSSSAINVAAVGGMSSRRRCPAQKFRGAAVLKPPPPERRILEHGKHHIYRGSTRTLMTCIFKTYHTQEALSWRKWKEADKDVCWQKFLDYFVLADGSNEAIVKKIFLDYGKANWSKWTYRARHDAAKVDPNFASNPQSKPPHIHRWLRDTEWRVFCNVWNSDAWKKKAAQAKNNRIKPHVKLVPCSGKKPLEERLATENQSQPSILRALEIGHKKDGTWSSSLAQTMHTTLKERVDQIQQTAVEDYGGAPEVDTNRWTGTGRAYSAAARHSIGSSRSDTSEQLRIMEELRKAREREEEQRKELEEQRRQAEERERKHLVEMEELKKGQALMQATMQALASQISTLTQHLRTNPPPP